jgi:histidine ammonia-lyase
MRNTTLDDVYGILFGGQQFIVTDDDVEAMMRCYHFLKDFATEKVIYGINTGFGPMAQWRVDDDKLKELQYNIIRSHSTGAGEHLDDILVKAAMIARVGTMLQARSGIHPEVPMLLQEFINRGIYPFIPQHGSVGASGDLVQLANIEFRVETK